MASDEALNPSATEEDEEDYVPESLADFVKQAEQGLEADLRFLDDLSASSPRRGMDTTGSDITEGDKPYNVSDIHAEMKNVSILDSAASLSRDDEESGEEIASPISARNPAADISDAEAKQALGDVDASICSDDESAEKAAATSEGVETDQQSSPVEEPKETSPKQEPVEESFKIEEKPELPTSNTNSSNDQTDEDINANNDGPDEISPATSNTDVINEKEKDVEATIDSNANESSTTATQSPKKQESHEDEVVQPKADIAVQHTVATDNDSQQQLQSPKSDGDQQNAVVSGAGIEGEVTEKQASPPARWWGKLMGGAKATPSAPVEAPSVQESSEKPRLATSSSPACSSKKQDNESGGSVAPKQMTENTPEVMNSTSPKQDGSGNDTPGHTMDAKEVSKELFADSPGKHPSAPSASLANAMQDLNISDISSSSSPGKPARSAQMKPGAQKGSAAPKDKLAKPVTARPRAPQPKSKPSITTTATAISSGKIKSRSAGPTRPSPPVGDQNGKGSSSRAPKTTGAAPSSRLLRPTAASRLHSPEEPPVQQLSSNAASSKTRSTTTSRFMRPTASVMAHHPASHMASRPAPLANRFMQPTASAKAHNQPVSPSVPSSSSVGRSLQNKAKTAVAPTSRFMRPTASALAHHQPTSPSAQSSSTSKSSGKSLTRPNVASTSRFMQPTASARAHHQPTSPSARSSITSRSTSRSLTKPAVSPTSRFMRPTAAARAHHTSESPSLRASSTAKIAPVNPTGRFMQPTAAAKLAHEKAEESSNLPKRNTNQLTVPHISSRLLKGTAATTARRGDKIQSSVPPTDAARDDAVARARERVRQRKQEANRAKSNGTSGAGLPRNTTARRPLTVPITPRFASSKTTAVKPKSQTDVSLAQSDALFGKGLRSLSPSVPLKSEPRKLTIPQGPKFLSKYEKKKAEKKAVDFSLAQSTNIRTKTLRSSSSAAASVDSESRRLTIPQSPKFHSVTKRHLPKSSAELELEMMEKYKSKPFKATANTNKNLHTGSSAGLTKVTKRRLTTPEPFKFTSSTKYGNKVSSERKQPSEVSHSDEKPKRFKARPVPKTTFSPSIPVHTLNSPAGSGSKGAKEGNATSKASAPKLSASRAEQRRAVVEASTKAAERISKQRADLANKANKEEDIVFKANEAQLKAKPFNFQSDRRHEAYRKQLEAKRKQEEEEERKKVKFHAKEWKSPPQPRPPMRSKRTPTKPEPFKLESLERHEAFQEMLQVKVASEEEEFKKHLVPKARPLPETTYVYKPISPSPSNLSAKSPGSHGSQALSDVSARS